MLSKAILLGMGLLLSCIGLTSSTHQKQVESVGKLIAARPGTYLVQAKAFVGSSNKVEITDGTNVITAYGQLQTKEQGLGDITLMKSGDSFRLVGFKSRSESLNTQSGILCNIRKLGGNVYGEVDQNSSNPNPCQGEKRLIQFNSRIR